VRAEADGDPRPEVVCFSSTRPGCGWWFVRTGAGAHGLHPSRNGRFLYVSDRAAGSVTVVSFQHRRVVATWVIGGSPDMGACQRTAARLTSASVDGVDLDVVPAGKPESFCEGGLREMSYEITEQTRRAGAHGVW
jgi:hypothetical protein